MNKRHGSVRGYEFDPDTEAWMRSHTIGDLKLLAMNMKSKGENVSGIMTALQTLEEIGQVQPYRMGDG